MNENRSERVKVTILYLPKNTFIVLEKINAFNLKTRGVFWAEGGAGDQMKFQ